MLFIHGIGVGLYPYTNILHDIRQHLNDSEEGEVGIIALEIMPISFRITHEALSSDVMVEEIHTILRHHGWDKVVLVTHSYGSVVATHLVKSPLTQKSIGPMVLIDPITFLLHHPDVAHNFTARKPIRANEHQLTYFARMDTGVAHTLGRRFFWTENIIWVEELGLGAPNGVRGVTIVMGGQDLIVNTQTVIKYLLAPTVLLDDATKTDVFTDGYASVLINGNNNIYAHGNGNVNGDFNGHAKGSKVGPAKRVPSVKLLDLTSSKDYFGAKLPVKTKGEWKSGPWEQSKINLLCFEHLDHAQVFDKAKSRGFIAEVIKRYSTDY
jgi:pimeloyl-ACP methyl ester carboxylesterase